MLWVWIKKSFMDAFMTILWLLVPPPSSYKAPVPHPVINPNADCPACGNATGKISCVPKFEDANAPGVMIRHTCSICGGVWHESTVIADNASLIYPSMSPLI